MEYEQESSEFNEAQLQVYRLHQKKINIDLALNLGNFNVARWELDSIETELNYDAKKLDKLNKTEYIIKLNSLNNKINKAAISFKNNPENDEFGFLFYQLLRQKRMLLDEIQNESGKGSKYRLKEKM